MAKVLVIGSFVLPPKQPKTTAPDEETSGSDEESADAASGSDEAQKKALALFKRAASSLGWSLARRKHELIVSSAGENYADGHVLDGAAIAAKEDSSLKTRVCVLRPDDGSMFPFQDTEPAKLLELRAKRFPGSTFEAGRFYQSQEADVVIAIGGKSGTSACGQIGLATGKPVIGIPHFDGAGKELWKAVRGYTVVLGPLGETLSSKLEGAWPDDEQKSNQAAETVVLALEEFAKNGAFIRNRQDATFRQVGLVAAEFLVLIAWLIGFAGISQYYEAEKTRTNSILTEPSASDPGMEKKNGGGNDGTATGGATSPKPVLGKKGQVQTESDAQELKSKSAFDGRSPLWLFGLAFCATTLGVFLRHSLSKVFDPTLSLAIQRIFTDLASGLILGFVLCLMYLIGAITVTGSPASTLRPEESGDFQRVAIVMSLMGLTGGFLVEQVADAVRSWLLEQMPKKPG